MAVWDAVKTDAGLTITGDSVTHTGSAGAERKAVSVGYVAPGEKKYFQIYCDLSQSPYNEWDGVGFGDSTTTGSGWVGQGSGDYGLYDNGNIYHAGGFVQNIGVTFTTSDYIGLAIDHQNDLFWARANGGNFNGSPSANPSTATGGFAFSLTGNIFILASPTGPSGDKMTGLQSSISWNNAAPGGFTAIGEGGGAASSLPILRRPLRIFSRRF